MSIENSGNNLNFEETHRSSQAAGVQNSQECLQPGQIILDRFKIIELLGSGGVGSVFRIKHLHLNTEFALKCLNRLQNSDGDWRRFEIEARAANRLDHPNLVKVHDSGLLPDGQPYFVMDLIEGETLSEAIRKRGTLPVNDALKIFIQVGFALAYAHQNGVIHRDIKPSNIMLTNQTESTAASIVKVVDFGLAKLTGSDEFSQQTLTKTGEIFGSPLYMSPEQCMGISVDHRSDLYSFGCVMYEVLSGAPPLIGESALSTMMKHQSEKPLSLKEASMGRTFPLKLEEIIFTLLEKDPKKRFQDSATLTAELAYLEQELRANRDKSVEIITSKINDKLKPITQKGDTQLKLSIAGIAFTVGLILGVFVTFSMMEQKVQSAQSEFARLKLESTSALPPFIRSVEGSQKQDAQPKPVTMDTQKYFSKINSKNHAREFNFEDADIGTIFSPQSFRYPTKGIKIFRNFKPFYFKTNSNCWVNPQVLDKFRDDELLAIEFTRSDADLKPFLEKLTRFKTLDRIAITDTEFGDKELPYLEKLTKLSSINLRGTDVSGQAIAKMKTLANMGEINLDSTPSAKQFIREGISTPRLRKLSVPRSSLTNQDVERIARNKKLEYLDLTKNIAIDDKAMPIIASLPNLEILVINSTGISANSIPLILKMSKLKNIQVRHWEKKDRDVLRRHGLQVPEDRGNPELESEYQREKPESTKKIDI